MEEAIEFLMTKINDFIENDQHLMKKGTYKKYTIITGKGKHSQDGQAKIRTAVLETLTPYDIEIRSPRNGNEGMLMMSLYADQHYYF